MLPGRFFKYKYQDKDLSSFYYSPIVTKGEEEHVSPTHPIYICFSENTIGFYISTRKKESPTLLKSPSLNHLLFEIPIDNDLGEKYFLELLETIYHENLQEYSGQIFDNSDYRFTGYKKVYPEKAIEYSKAKMFLDFLFDLTHSQVFDICRNSFKIKRFIQNNFLIQAIICKCEYFFSRAEYSHFRASLKSKVLASSNISLPVLRNIFHQIDWWKSPKGPLELFSNRIKQAEEKWLQILFQENSKKFYFSSWFNEEEEEIDRILIKEESENIRFDRMKWRRGQYLYFSKDKKNAENSIKTERISILNFYIKRFEFYNAYRYIRTVHPIYGSLGAIILNKVFLMAIFIASLIFSYYKNLSIFIFFLGIIGLCLSLVFPFTFLLTDLVFHRIISFFKKFPSIIHVNICAPKMTISILTGWLTLFPFSEELWEWNGLAISYQEWCWGFNLGLLVLIFLLIFFEIKSAKPFQKTGIIFWKLGRIFFIGFSFSVGVGLILFHLTSTYIFDNYEVFPASKESIVHIRKIKSIAEKPEKIYEIAQQIESLKNLPIQERNTLIGEIEVEEIKADTSLKGALDSLLNILDDSTFNRKSNEVANTIRNYGYTLDLQIHKDIQKEVIQIAKDQMEKYAVPLIAYINLKELKIFLFPRLLILNSLIAFIIGFVIQFVIEAKVYRESM